MSSIRIRTVFFVLMATLFVMVFSASPSRAALYLNQADLDQGDDYAYNAMFDPVGFMYLKKDGLWQRGGSGVLIDSQWVLTAGHVIVGNDDLGGGISDIQFFTGHDLFGGDYQRAIADAWYIYPGFSGSHAPATGVDLGLLHLTDPVVGVDPAVLFSGEDQRGTVMHMAGFGRPGTAANGYGAFDGIKRAGNNIAQEFGGDRPPWHRAESQYWLADFNAFYDDAQPLEWQTTPGDSGGGWFAQVGGEMQLVGINSGWLGDYGDGVSTAIRTSLYNDWIYETMDSHPSVPEPSSFLMFLTGSLVFGSWSAIRRRWERAA